jgi:hypothetical protein
MIAVKIYAILLLPFFLCSEPPYDTSTPEKFVESMGLICQQREGHNPLPYFYDSLSAEAIYQFDETGEKALIAFDNFRNALAEKFPNHIKTNVDGRLKVSLDGYAGMKIRNFTYSASLVGAQLKARKASDYEFISYTAPNEEGIINLTLKISGKQKIVPLKKTEEGYRMFLDQDVLDKLARNTQTVEKLRHLFISAHEKVVSNQITKENFEEKIDAVSLEYEEVLRGA